MPYTLPGGNDWMLQLRAPLVRHRPYLVDKLGECVDFLATSASPLQVKLSVCLLTLQQGQPGMEPLDAFNDEDRAIIIRRCNALLAALTDAFREADGNAALIEAMPDEHAERFAHEFVDLHDVLLHEYPAYEPRRGGRS